MKVFAVEKFKSLLMAGSFTVLATYFVRLTGSVVAGHLLGEDALAGINLVAPCLSVVSFFTGLVSSGMATHYSLEMGRCRRDRARQFFVQGVWTLLIVGGALAVAFRLGGGLFLDLFDSTPAIALHARSYLDWYWPIVLLEGLSLLLLSLCYADGDTRLCLSSYVVLLIGNPIFSVLGVRLGMGAGGCAFGSLLADICCISVLLGHFFRKSNTCAWTSHFSVRDTLSIISASFGDSAAFLCDAALIFFLNVYFIRLFGAATLPVVAVITAAWGFQTLFNGISVALQPIVAVYFAEQNVCSVRAVMRSAMWFSLWEGLALTAFFLFCPKVVVSLVGVTDPELVRQSIVAVRLVSCGFVFLAFAGLFNSYYMFVERPILAAVMTFLCYLVMTSVCTVVFSLARSDLAWLGLGLGPGIGLSVTAAFVLTIAGRGKFPLLLDSVREAGLRVFSLALTEAEIAQTSEKVSDALKRSGQSDSIALKASLMTEEVLMVVRDRNRGRRVLGEVTLDMNEGVRLTIRDDGEIFDITDADAEISSLRTFLVASMMQRQDDRLNLVTTGFNRNVFKFV